jgi:hypothetical protein
MSDPTGLRTQNVALISAGVVPADLPRGDVPDAPPGIPVRRFTSRQENLPKIHWFGELSLLPSVWRALAVAHVGIAIQGCEKDPAGFTYVADIAGYMTAAGLQMPIFHEALRRGLDRGYFESGPLDRQTKRRGVRLADKWYDALRSGNWDDARLVTSDEELRAAYKKASVARQVLRGLVAAFDGLVGVRLVTAPDLSAATLELRLLDPEYKYGMTALERAFDDYRCALRRLTDGTGRGVGGVASAVLGAPIPDTIRHNP